MNRTAALIVAGLAGVLVLVLAFSGGRFARTTPRLEREPDVRLVVNEQTGETRTMPMESYIQGVVAGEMGALPSELGDGDDWPEAAYAAQAILARSFALSFLGDDGNVVIKADVTEAQAYAPEKITEAISRAVESTRGMVLESEGSFVKAWFHSYSGGHTATAKEGLNYREPEPGFVVARKMPDNDYVPDETRSWQAVIGLSEVSAAMRELGRDVGDVTGVSVKERGPSGRATILSVTGDAGGAEVHAAELRRALDPERVRSTLFEGLRVEGDRLYLSGLGFGHGVGLSQWDAYAFAKAGRSAEEIMKEFFQGIEVVKAWD